MMHCVLHVLVVGVDVLVVVVVGVLAAVLAAVGAVATTGAAACTHSPADDWAHTVAYARPLNKLAAWVHAAATPMGHR